MTVTGIKRNHVTQAILSHHSNKNSSVKTMPAGTGSQKKIRDLNRSIQKAGDDAEKIALLRGKIQEIENDKTGRLEKDKRSKHENKYHLVKFVERKKLTRSIQRTLRELESSENSDQRNQLQTLLDSLKDDLTYVM